MNTYYVSAALMQGRGDQAGSVKRVPAAELESLVLNAVGVGRRGESEQAAETEADFGQRSRFLDEAAGRDNHDDIGQGGRSTVDALASRIVVHAGRVEIELNEETGSEVDSPPIVIPWSPTPAIRRRAILGAPESPTESLRAMPEANRRTILAHLAKAHRWLEELLNDPTATTDAIAAREGQSERSIRRSLSLAFLAPDITAAAVDGRLPRGLTIKRLFELPSDWLEQPNVLGLTALRSSP